MNWILTVLAVSESGGILRTSLRILKIREGIIIPSGRYSYNNYNLMLNTQGQVFNGRFGFNIGNFYNGTRRGFDLRLDLRLTGRFSLEPRYEFNRVTLPEGSFDTNVFGGRVVYSFSTDLFTKVYVQWNSDRNLVTTNFLVNYIYRPGSDFYFCFQSDLWDRQYINRVAGHDLGWQSNVLVESMMLLDCGEARTGKGGF